jgi:hypothetical protein
MNAGTTTDVARWKTIKYMVPKKRDPTSAITGQCKVDDIDDEEDDDDDGDSVTGMAL